MPLGATTFFLEVFVLTLFMGLNSHVSIGPWDPLPSFVFLTMLSSSIWMVTVREVAFSAVYRFAIFPEVIFVISLKRYIMVVFIGE